MNKGEIMHLDYPDPDVIRVGKIYYMVSTTMHFFPGCEILKSQDLTNWEHAAYVYDVLDSTPGQKLTEDLNIYGKGMWAASLRFHKGKYYVCFVANDTGKTYLYTSNDIYGTWTKSYIDGFYHDCSLLFDDDRVYIAYGNTDIYITELNEELSGAKVGGLHRLAVSDKGNSFLGYEGTHFYKINGKYYLFFIHSLRDKWRRVEACFVADTIDGEFKGGDVFDEDCGYCGQGMAQGGIVDTPDGKWYAMLFQDKGAVGRLPVLIPVIWENDYPVFLKPDYTEETHNRRNLIQSDNFKQMKGLNAALYKSDKEIYGCYGLKSCWQFNHEPDFNLVKLDNTRGIWSVTTDKLSNNLTQAKNTITQRMYYPKCAAQIKVDAAKLKNGDFAGICALQAQYGMIALTLENDNFYLVMREYSGSENEAERILLKSSKAVLRISVDFTDMKDEAIFEYLEENTWRRLGVNKKLVFDMEHFCGCRFGLFMYSTVQAGGEAEFSKFIYDTL